MAIKDDRFSGIDRYPHSKGFGKMATPFIVIWGQLTDQGAGGEIRGVAPHDSECEILELRDHKAGVKHARVRYHMPVLHDEEGATAEPWIETVAIEGWVSCRMLQRLGELHGKWK